MSGLHEVGEQVSDGCRLPGERVPAVRWLAESGARGARNGRVPGWHGRFQHSLPL